MTNLDKFKKGVSFVIGVGVSHIVYNIVDNNTSEDEGTLRLVSTYAGKVGIAMLVSDLVEDHVGTKIDELAASFKKMKERFNELLKEDD